jgi:hypothetical protein
MARAKTTFQLDTTDAGKVILQTIAMTAVEKSANAIASRASSMASSQSRDPIVFGTSSEVGTIKKGKRAIATVAAVNVNDNRSSYLAHIALVKAIDAGRIN